MQRATTNPDPGTPEPATPRDPEQHDPAEPGGSSPGPSPLNAREGLPRLPRVYVPRLRLWEQLERATDHAVTLLVAPVGAGKTLGVSGWLHYSPSPQAEDAVWITADSTWSPERLDAVLDDADTHGGRPGVQGRAPRLVVVDDAHLLPAAALRLIDHRLSEVPERLRVLLISRWDLPLTRLMPELLGHFTTLRGEILRMGDAECAALVSEHARTDDPVVVRSVTEQAQGWCAVVV